MKNYKFHVADSAKISNVSMFNPEVRPHTAHYTRGTGLERSSNILKNFSYPVDPRFEPGVQSRPKTGCEFRQCEMFKVRF